MRQLAALGLIFAPALCMANTLVDDFSAGSFSLSSSDDRYETQTVQSTNLIQGFRYEENVLISNPFNGLMSSRIEAGSQSGYRFSCEADVTGVLSVVWAAGLKSGYEPSGPGGLDVSSVNPFEPFLDLKGASSLQRAYSDSTSEVPVTFGIYDSVLRHVQFSHGLIRPGMGTVSVPISDFANIDVGRTGILILQFEVTGKSAFTLDRFEVVPEPPTILVFATIGASILTIRGREKLIKC